MNTTKLVAIALIVLGALGLAYGGFTYTSDTHKAEIGALQLQVEEKERVNVPVWLGLGAVLAGVALLVIPRKA
jgi:TRAP-type C4-dicarboxylate transport system permease small subunit